MSSPVPADSRPAAPMSASEAGHRVPAVVHLIKTDSRPLTRFLFLNIVSILHNLNPSTLYLHVTTPPYGFFWNLTLQFYPVLGSKIVVQPITTPVLLHGKEPRFKKGWEEAHQSDIIRMNILSTLGGIYLDTDVLPLRSFNPLRRSDFTIGLQTMTKMCNGVILAHPQSVFLRDWYAQIGDANFTTCWDCHSIELPSKMWAEHKKAQLNASSSTTNDTTISVLPLEAFYDPSFSRSDLHELFREQEKGKRLIAPYEGKFAVHLWNRVHVASRYMSRHRLEEICFSSSMYNEMLRFALRGSPFLHALCEA